MAHTLGAHSLDKPNSGTPASTARRQRTPRCSHSLAGLQLSVAVSHIATSPRLASLSINPAQIPNTAGSIRRQKQRTAGGGAPHSVRRVDESQESDEWLHESGSQPTGSSVSVLHQPRCPLSVRSPPLLIKRPCCCCRSNRRTIRRAPPPSVLHSTESGILL